MSNRIKIAIGSVLLAAIAAFIVFAAANSKEKNEIGEINYEPTSEDHIAVSEDGITMYADNELLVVADKDVSKKKIEKLAKKYDAEIVGCIEQTGDYQWKFKNAKTEKALETIIETISSEKTIVSSSFNYIGEFVEADVQEQKVGEKWAISKNNIKWGVEKTDTELAWELMNNIKKEIAPVNVGLIDVGFDEAHEDLSFAENGVFYNNENQNGLTKEDADKISRDHGTHVAGIMAANGTNDKGICGVYPYSSKKLYAVALDKKYDENSNYHSSIMFQKIAFSELILRNVRVINESLGFNFYEDPKYKNENSIDYNEVKEYFEKTDFSGYEKEAAVLGDFLDRLIKEGYDFVIVSAAGNDSDDDVGHFESKYSSWVNMIEKDDYPDVYNRIIVVGNVNKFDHIASSSNAGERVDIFAPGENIYSTLPGNSYGKKSGTSMAAPHVAGICADMWSICSTMNGNEIKDELINSYDPDVVVYTSDSGNKKYLVNAAIAVLAAKARSTDVAPENEDMGMVLGFVKTINQNGVQSKTSEAIVKAYKDDGSAEVVKETRSDINSHFEIVLPEGNYIVSAEFNGIKSEEDHVIVKSNQVAYIKPLELYVDDENGNTSSDQADNNEDDTTNAPESSDDSSIKSKKIVDVSIGAKHTLALTEGGEVYAWGDNEEGQLGVDNDFTLYSNEPVKVMENVRDIETYWNGSYAITNNDELYVWGNYTNTSPSIDVISRVPKKYLDNVNSTDGWYLLTNDRKLYGFYDAECSLPNPISEDVIYYSTDEMHDCYVTSDNVMHTTDPEGCREDVVAGAVGNVGNKCYMAIGTDSKLLLWGEDDKGSIPFGKIDNAHSICTDNWNFGCIDNNGTAYVWGFDYDGQLGDGLSGGGEGAYAKGYYSDKFVLYKDNVRTLDVGLVTAAVTNDNKLYMSGHVYGNDDVVSEVREIADDVLLYEGNDSVNWGWGVFAVIKTDGSLYLWGNNENGQIGDGTKTSSTELIRIN